MKDVAFFDDDRHRTGELISRLNSDCEVVKEALTMALPNLIKSLIQIIVVVIILLTISKTLTGYVLLGNLVILMVAIPFLTVMNKLGKAV